MLKLETILKDTLWVAKMQGWREVGTWDEVERYAHDEECRDCDICCEQPEHLREFYDAYFKYDQEHGFITVQDYYNTVYSKRKVWTAEEIGNLVQTNDKVLMRALKKLYDCQTFGEQMARATHDANGVGFNAYDAEVLTSICEFMIQRGYLTDKQKSLVRRKLKKYTKQLTKLANAA